MKEKNINLKDYFLGLQHVCAMFGSTVLVPFLTGLDVSVAILSAGVSTLIFHYVTQYKMPVFLGSSFAFIPVTLIVLQNYSLAYLKCGIIAAGLMYLIFSVIVNKIGVEKVKSFLPNTVVGPVIIAIGLKLSPVALSMAGYKAGNINYSDLLLSGFTLFVVIILSFMKANFFRLFPILISIIMGYIFACILGYVDFTNIAKAPMFGLSSKSLAAITTLPQFDLNVVFLVAPIALVVFLEHIGDVEANSAVVGKTFMKDPGLHRSLLGDGLATMFAGFVGAPGNTTYSENTGVLAVTKNYSPKILRIAAVFAIIIAFLGKLTAIVQSIPVPVMGGVSILLFGLIASIGIRTLVSKDVDFNNHKNLVIPAIVIIIGVFVDSIPVTHTFSLSGLFVATLSGILLNIILPNRQED